MKRIFGFFPLFLFLVACSNAPAAGEVFVACSNAPAVGDVFDGTVNDYEGVTMTILEGTARPDTVAVAVLNTTEVEIYSGNAASFGLQIEQDGQWYWLETEKDYVNTMEAFVYTKDKPREWTFTWGNSYGSLEPGHYRVTKWFFEYRGPGECLDFLLASEFTLE